MSSQFEEKIYCTTCKKVQTAEINADNTYTEGTVYNKIITFTHCPICFNKIPLHEKTYHVKFNFGDEYEEIEVHTKYKAGMEYANMCLQMFDNVKHLIVFREEG